MHFHSPINTRRQQKSPYAQLSILANKQISIINTSYILSYPSTINLVKIIIKEEEKSQERRYMMIRWKSGQIVDPRLLELLESFKEIYVKRNEFFKKIFPGNIYEDFVQVFKKFSDKAIWENKKVTTMQRSLSFGSTTPREFTGDDQSELRLERFKVSTPPVMVIGPNGEGGQTDKGDKNGYF